MSFREENVLFQEITGLENSKNITKSDLRKIEVSELPENMPNFRKSSQTKNNILAEWLKSWINTKLAQGKLQINDLLPSKNEIAEKTSLSIGTVQTAIRIMEDEGYVASKQRIGTFICDRSVNTEVLRKQTSKRDNAIESIKRYIIKQNYQPGEVLPSSREMSKIIGSAPNTTRLAVEFLANTGIIEPKNIKKNKTGWILKLRPEISDENFADQSVIDTDTLVNQIERELKELILKNYKVGDKLISHYEIAESFKVSIKTVHDAIKRLVEQGIIQARRGRYGSFILRMPSDKQIMTGKENEIFAPATEASLYNYEKVETYLKTFIKENFKMGDKLPSMGKLAEKLQVSSNTIRKALQNLADNEIVSFSRGRYGGTFLINLPDIEKKQEKATLSWLAVNADYISAYSNKN
ncbi:MAG TPA: GntR family transcriptional regulator [Candidatus Gastranaerophilales bacterium]|nr:GntR family transcriptional regulator [Candidatus Gastranaerophilales bacterium]